MKYLLAILGCVLLGATSVATIKHIDYCLPADWVAGNTLQTEKGTTVIFVPEGMDTKTSKELFGVSSNPFSSNLSLDETALQKELADALPNMNVILEVLENNDQSSLYEWAAFDGMQEKFHGWGRIFSSAEGTTVLSYQTENISDISQARSLWIPILKAAKLPNKGN